ncbi:MAG: aminopeptidase P family protein [Chthoniobacterales bacterium]|nr:aminopeptidase P family protein [Chthoniobacterales bacterium]
MARLLCAPSPQSADMLYATGFQAPDPFLFLEHGGVKTIVLGDLEFDRGRRDARVDEILPLSELAREAGGNPSLPAIAVHLLRRFKVRRVDVPSDFPLGMARAIERAGVKVFAIEGHFWPERECKTAEEIRAVKHALHITKAGILRAVEVLRAAGIGRNGILRWNGKTLTSEIVRAESDAAVLRAGGVPDGTIVAGGRQACDPHERGHGPLRAHELIILDIFPRDARSGFFGDITRTVVRGRASDAQRCMWETVRAAQRLAISMIKPSVRGAEVHDAVKRFFADRGYPTGRKRGRWTGFFHGTGHGLGLDLHEEPRLAATTFRTGQVFTVEPGLYYPETGGVRHEDVVAVTRAGCERLSRVAVPLELH